jgi:hypothetical protein
MERSSPTSFLVCWLVGFVSVFAVLFVVIWLRRGKGRRRKS